MWHNCHQFSRCSYSRNVGNIRLYSELSLPFNTYLRIMNILKTLTCCPTYPMYKYFGLLHLEWWIFWLTTWARPNYHFKSLMRLKYIYAKKQSTLCTVTLQTTMQRKQKWEGWFRDGVCSINEIGMWPCSCSLGYGNGMLFQALPQLHWKFPVPSFAIPRTFFNRWMLPPPFEEKRPQILARVLSGHGSNSASNFAQVLEKVLHITV